MEATEEFVELSYDKTSWLMEADMSMFLTESDNLLRARMALDVNFPDVVSKICTQRLVDLLHKNTTHDRYILNQQYVDEHYETVDNHRARIISALCNDKKIKTFLTMKFGIMKFGYE